MWGSFEGRLTLAVVGYATLQLALRLLIGSSLELDEAEAFYHARRLAWGYGPQPPLYNWLQWGLFQVLGEGLLAIAVLKATILASTVLGLFAILRRETDPAAAGVAALSLSFLPQVVWEGQRALTHSMLALLAAVLTLGLAIRALRRGRWGDYLLLGLAVGLGVLSKFNFAIWPAGLLAAALALPEWRRELKAGRIAAAILAAALLVAPVALWMLRNPELATGSLGKLETTDSSSWAALPATGALLAAAIGFLGLPLLVLGGFRAFARRAGFGRGASVARFLAVASGLSLGLLWLGMLLTGTTEMRERWLLPFAWGLAPAGVLWLWPWLEAQGRRALGGVAAGLWLLAVPLLPYASLVDPGWRGGDFRGLIQTLQDLEAGEGGVETDSIWIAGNLAFLAPELDPQLVGPGHPPRTGAVRVLERNMPDGSGRTMIIPRGRRPVEVELQASTLD